LSESTQQPSGAYVGASWASLIVGVAAYCAGLWNASMQLNEKGFYFAVLAFGLFAAVSLQKTVRDQQERIRTTAVYLGISWAAFALPLIMLAVGLWNAALALSEKGFFAMAFVLALFAAITVQKNIRDVAVQPGSASRAVAEE
jgi:uncharacterized membrane protein YiaA